MAVFGAGAFAAAGFVLGSAFGATCLGDVLATSAFGAVFAVFGAATLAGAFAATGFTFGSVCGFAAAFGLDAGCVTFAAGFCAGTLVFTAGFVSTFGAFTATGLGVGFLATAGLVSALTAAFATGFGAGTAAIFAFVDFGFAFVATAFFATDICRTACVGGAILRGT
ncbi:MAG: hypothetical protein AAFN63_19575, partial [Pseudomonadota bacterium]